MAVRALFPSPLWEKVAARSAAEGRSDEGCWPSTGIDEIVSRYADVSAGKQCNPAIVALLATPLIRS